MAFDSAADLLFNIGANSDDAEANIARFRSLLGTDLDAMGAQFSDWADKVFGEMETVKGALLGITAATAAGVVAAGAFAVESAHKFEEYALAIGDAQQKTGLTTETLSAMHLAAHETGVRFEQSVFAAQDPTSKQAQLLERMGFTTDQVKGALGNIDPFLDEFGKRFATLHEGPEKTGVAMEFMGRAGAANIKFMQQWAARAEEFRRETRELGMELDPTAVKAAREYATSVKLLDAQWEAFHMRIGEFVLPQLQKVLIFTAGMVEVLKEGAFDVGHFSTAFVAGAREMTESIEAAAKSAQASVIIKDLLDKHAKAPKTKEAAEDIHTLTDRLDEMKLKMAELEGPEAKLTVEIGNMLG